MLSPNNSLMSKIPHGDFDRDSGYTVTGELLSENTSSHVECVGGRDGKRQREMRGRGGGWGGGPEYRQKGKKKTTARYVTGREHRDKLITDRQEQRKCASGG